jgi:TolB-like protein/DNA-binding winged helix-turn-helix (wHTH) protein/cytochrome c-type biogenesis protein CcmH/NrfG
MGDPNRSSPVIRFGVFEFDPEAGELRKQGLKVKLHGQPAQVLELLLQRPGRVVTREELREKLWPEQTFVDFEHGLNAAIQRLREALGDSADNPRFVETLPRRGYRFIAPVEEPGRPAGSRVGAEPRRRFGWQVRALVAVLLLAVVSVAGYFARQRFWPQAKLPTGKVMLAVLPFDNLSGESEQEYFSDGLTDEMISQLGRLQPERLGVIARTSAMYYKGTNKRLDEIGRELGVDYVLEGSVRRDANRVRITAQLIQLSDQTQLWAESYERDLRDILALQSEVAQTVARQLQLKLTPQEQTRLATIGPVHPEAYEAYLWGRRETYLVQWGSPEGYLKGIEYYRQAIQKDPDYALAYAGLAHAYHMLWSFHHFPASESLDRSRAANLRALELDPTLSEAHVNLGAMKFWRDGDWSGGEAALRHAVELDPGSVDAQLGYANCLSVLGRHDRAIRLIKRARQLDPLSPVINAALADALVGARQYERAIEQYRETIELDPKVASPYLGLGNIYHRLGRYEEAVAAYLEWRRLSGDSPERVQALHDAYRTSGMQGYLRKRIEHLKDIAKHQPVSPLLFAIVYTHKGDKDRALEWLEKAYQQQGPGILGGLKVLPMFDPLRDDPRFHSLLRRLNFPE